jgi:hypothetical protein
LLRFDTPDAPSNERATAHLRVTVKDPDPRRVGRAFSNATMELALGGYAGFHTTTPPTAESAYGVYRAAAVPRAAVSHTVVLPDGSRRAVPDPPVGAPLLQQGDPPPIQSQRGGPPPIQLQRGGPPPIQLQRGGPPPIPAPAGPTRRAPLGVVCGARSGDKGGDANIGVWTRTDAAYGWLRGFLHAERVRALLGTEAAELPIEVHQLPNLRALNVVVHGLLGEGVASSTRQDPQAKGLGEYLRSRVVDIPESVMG